MRSIATSLTTLVLLPTGPDERTASGNRDDQSVGPEDVERPADSTATDSVMLLEVALARYRLAWLDLARFDGTPKDVRKLDVKRGWVHVINSHPATVADQAKRAVCLVWVTSATRAS